MFDGALTLDILSNNMQCANNKIYKSWLCSLVIINLAICHAKSTKPTAKLFRSKLIIFQCLLCEALETNSIMCPFNLFINDLLGRLLLFMFMNNGSGSTSKMLYKCESVHDM